MQRGKGTNKAAVRKQEKGSTIKQSLLYYLDLIIQLEDRKHFKKMIRTIDKSSSDV